MRRLYCALISLVLLLNLSSCGGDGSVTAWQEQYELGARYLSEGNYEDAVIAFTAAIGIDPKRLEGYTGLAEAYIGAGDYDKAADAVTQGRQACGNTGEFDRLHEEIAAQQGADAENSDSMEKEELGPEGHPLNEKEKPQKIRQVQTSYYASSDQPNSVTITEFELGIELPDAIYKSLYLEGYHPIYSEEQMIDENGDIVPLIRHEWDYGENEICTQERYINVQLGEMLITSINYQEDEQGNIISYEMIDHDMNQHSMWYYEYDSNGRITNCTNNRVTNTYEYDSNGNLVKKIFPSWFAANEFDYTIYEYDAQNRVARSSTAFSAPMDKSLDSLNYTLYFYGDSGELAELQLYSPESALTQYILVSYEE